MLIIVSLIIVALIVCGVLYARYRVYLYSWYTDFPWPKYRVIIDKNTMIPMPDGTKLAMDIYRPKSFDKFPVILIRTPYNKKSNKPLALLFASQGYAVVIQDVRGKYRSEGEFYPYAYEALDGHTTVMWAGDAPWSNGKLALFGISYAGSCAWLTARYKSVYLKTIISLFTTQNTYSIWINNGIPFLKGPLMWLSKFCSKKENKKITDQSIKPALWKLPVNLLDIFAAGRKIPFYSEYLAHQQPDSFWEEISAHHNIGNLDISAFIVGGWYDPFLSGTIEDYQRMKGAPAASKNHHSRLLIGPWPHNPTQKFKGVEFGHKAHFNSILISILDWCDIWLKDVGPADPNLKKVRYFMMGQNVWRESDLWPPKTGEIHYFLSDEKNERIGLLASSPSPQTYKKHFIYDPRDPVLFKGSYMLHGGGWAGPIEQNEIIARREVLIYNTSQLSEEICIAGSAKLILYVSSDAVDTDFHAKICDTHPNGKSYNLTSGFVRMRFRESLQNPELMIPGKVYRIEILFKAVAHAFLKGHRLQLQITSSDFPVHNRNLNTGLSCEASAEMKEAEQTIYTGLEHESCLILPQIL